ncbi:MAG: glycosyltransferase family 4 protein [Pyrinomonadaceae bacterium]
MNVCVLTTFPPAKCGIADFTEALCTEMSRFQDLFISVLTNKGPTTEDRGSVSPFRIIDTVDFHRSPTSLIRLVREVDPDVVHLQMAPSLFSNIDYVTLATAIRPPLITTVHETCPLAIRHLHNALPFMLLYNSSRRLIVHSERTKRLLTDSYRISAKKIVHIDLGVDLERFTSNESTGLWRQLKVGSHPLIMFFGFLRPDKRIEDLIAAFANIKKDLPGAKLVLAGEELSGRPPGGGYTDLLTKLAAKLNVRKDVTFTGYVDASEVCACFATADIVVLPHEDRFQSASISWAFAAKKPVIARRSTAFNEVVKDGQNGLLFDTVKELSDCIKRLAIDPGLAMKLAENARKFSESRFNLQTVALKHRQVYSAVNEEA